MKKFSVSSAFVLASLVYSLTMAHACTLNVDGIVSGEVTPGELGRITVIKISVSKCRRAAKASSCRLIYKTSISKIPATPPNVFSSAVVFPGDCPALLRIDVSTLDASGLSYAGPPLFGSTGVNTEKTRGDDVTVRMIPEPTF